MCSTVLPDYWIERPPLRTGRATEAAVDAFLRLADANAGGELLDVDALLNETTRVTRWQFLCSLAARRRIAFHGTGDPDIERFEPREPIDYAPFGKQRAVFATSDPIWAMFYAIVDRGGHELTLNNACLLLEDTGDAYYYFSVSRQALPWRPWRTGYLYFLPSDTFVEQPGRDYAGRPARVPQLASPVAVAPFARLRIAPRSFPFLGRIRGHDDERLGEYAQAVMSAAPWPD
ncbi:MAG TPA: hypothetical protein VGM80_16015 [Gaiellaceae bacterium]